MRGSLGSKRVRVGDGGLKPCFGERRRVLPIFFLGGKVNRVGYLGYKEKNAV